jgi:hypothetical protein
MQPRATKVQRGSEQFAGSRCLSERGKAYSSLAGTYSEMLLNPDKTFIGGFLCAVILFTGCSARRPIESTAAPFRLETLNHDAVLLPPTVPEHQASDAAFRATLPVSATHSAVRIDCSAERGPFRVEQTKNDPNSIQITLPAPEKWLEATRGQAEADGIDAVQALYALLADLDQLQQKGCFEESASIREFILQSLPMKPAESLFYSYGYRAGRSSVELKPGMRLKIERAYFRGAEAADEEHTTENSIGVGAVTYNVEPGSNAKIHFRQIGNVRYSPRSLSQTIQNGNSGLSLSGLPQESHYRLLLYTVLVAKEHKLSAAILGADRDSQLDGLDEELRKHPDAACKYTATTPGVACMEFDRFVALTPQIEVELNGKTKFLDWGTRIRDVLPENTLKALRIQRRFMNSYSDVNFDPGDANLLALPLVSGDRLTW